MISSPRKGAIAVSIIAHAMFFLALVASAAIAWTKNDFTILTAMCGVAATNVTTVVAYWVGSSEGSAKKTDFLIRTQTMSSSQQPSVPEKD